jgi:DNA-binding NtrC family response regulator
MNLPAPTILIVDDDGAVRESIARVLTLESYHVRVARSVKDALEHLSAITPDLVLTDLCMVPLTGWDLIVHLRNRLPHIPVLVLTALPLPLVGECTDAIAEAFRKPVDLELLVTNIRRQLAGAALRPDSP